MAITTSVKSDDPISTDHTPISTESFNFTNEFNFSTEALTKLISSGPTVQLSTETVTSTTPGSGGLGTGVIIGISAAGTIAICVIIIAIFLVTSKCRSSVSTNAKDDRPPVAPGLDEVREAERADRDNMYESQYGGRVSSNSSVTPEKTTVPIKVTYTEETVDVNQIVPVVDPEGNRPMDDEYYDHPTARLDYKEGEDDQYYDHPTTRMDYGEEEDFYKVPPSNVEIAINNDAPYQNWSSQQNVGSSLKAASRNVDLPVHTSMSLTNVSVPTPISHTNVPVPSTLPHTKAPVPTPLLNTNVPIPAPHVTKLKHGYVNVDEGRTQNISLPEDNENKITDPEYVNRAALFQQKSGDSDSSEDSKGIPDYVNQETFNEPIYVNKPKVPPKKKSTKGRQLDNIDLVDFGHEMENIGGRKS